MYVKRLVAQPGSEVVRLVDGEQAGVVLVVMVIPEARPLLRARAGGA
jgi:hypothetical protein